MLHLSIPGARALMLAAQGLLDPPPEPATKVSILETIRRMGALQIDTISVVARSPYLVLWSRVGPFESGWLDELLAEGNLFEYWSHAACFLPIDDYPLYRHSMLYKQERSPSWVIDNEEITKRVLQRVTESGALRSADWERTDGRSSGWWDWKPEKHALEHLFNIGTLMVARRERFQRVYDLRERVHPDWDDSRTPGAEEVRRTLTLKAVQALGVTTARWIPDYFKTPARGVDTVLDELVEEGHVVLASIEGLAPKAYIHSHNVTLAAAAAGDSLQPRRTTLLSPFDPLVWDRTRAAALFQFMYRIETYTPTAKRRYGYFSMPILHRGELVGRLDPKAHRKEGILEIRSLHLEEGIRPTEELISSVGATLKDFAAWQGLNKVKISGPNALVGIAD